MNRSICRWCHRELFDCVNNPCFARYHRKSHPTSKCQPVKKVSDMKCPNCDRDTIICDSEPCGYKKRYDPLKRNCVIDSIVNGLVCPDCGGHTSETYSINDVEYCTECGQFMREELRKTTREDTKMPDRIMVINGHTYFSQEYVDEMREECHNDSNATVLSSSLVRTTMGNFLRLDLVEEGRTPGCAPNVLFAPGHRISVRTVDDE